MKVTPHPLPENFPKSRIWGICAYFNPQLYPGKLKNYRIFRQSLLRQKLPLLTVELAFGDKPFSLNKDDAEILVQVRANSVLWQKERLLNIGMKKLPDECDQIVWLDTDVLFRNDHWVAETSLLLESYKAVQPYEFCVRLPKDCLWEDTQNLLIGDGIGEKRPSAAMGYVNGYPRFLYRTGLSWAIRKEILETAGFYDRLILGSGDVIIYDALCGNSMYMHQSLYLHFTTSQHADIAQWRDKIVPLVEGNVFYTSGDLLSLYHGTEKNRQYRIRHSIFEQVDFDPGKDLCLNEDGCWEWASNKPKLHRFARNYFWLRNEESSQLKELYIVAAELSKRIFYAGIFSPLLIIRDLSKHLVLKLWNACKKFALRFEIIRKHKQEIKRWLRMT